MEIAELVNDYLIYCKAHCNKGGFGRLESDTEQIKLNLIKKYSTNGDSKMVSGLIDKCHSRTFSFIEREKLRLLGWMDESYERKLRQEINTDLQSA
jgi:hypothetical protein